MTTRIQLRHGTDSEWSAANPTLAAGEAGFSLDTKVFKVGDGFTDWNSLPSPEQDDVGDLAALFTAS